jgi:hypothetical protein
MVLLPVDIGVELHLVYFPLNIVAAGEGKPLRASGSQYFITVSPIVFRILHFIVK